MAFTDLTTGGRVVKEGIMPIRITLSDTCNVGDLIGYEGITDDEWQRADANGKVLAQLVAGEKCDTSGDEIVCFKMAYIDFGSDCDATSGDMVYLADDVGEYASTPASWVMQCVGECVSDQLAFIHPSCSPVSAFASTGTGWAGYFRSEVESGRTATDLWGGVRIDFKSIATSDVASDAYGLYIFAQLLQAPVGSSAMIRLEDGCNTSCGLDSWVYFVGGSNPDPPDFLFVMSTPNPTNSAWDINANTPSGQGGYFKVQVGGFTRYITLFTGHGG